MKRTIADLDPDRCTGCLLCYNVCPERAIILNKNPEGFLVPEIAKGCTQCGSCAKSCPELSSDYRFNRCKSSYAMICKDSLRSRCSSGGVFAALSEETISKGGIVYGAAFSPDCKELSLVGIERRKDLPKIYKSKYVQANANVVYSDVKKKLEMGAPVIFSGCPCQVNALKVFLRKDYENLVAVDILCHGVPSPLAYNSFLDEVSNGKKIASVDFRDKKYGWGTLISVKFADETIHYDYHDGHYFYSFLSGLSMRESCFKCPYSRPERCGDITLGDFWGVDQYNASYSDGKGTSLVICNTQKGIAAIDGISEKIELKKEIPYEKVVEISAKTNGALVRPTYRPRMRDCFFNHLSNGDSFSKSVRYAKTSLIDVGIVGWWNETARSNYGSTLTNYALYRYLQSLGLSVAFVSPPNFDRTKAGNFNKKYEYRMTAKYSAPDMVENNRYIDTFIVGSDVLWYYDAFIKTKYTMMLDFVDDDKRMISYATSFGNTKKFFPEHEMPFVKYLLKRFDSISVREHEAVEICRDVFNIDATQVLDPVFLCDISQWEELSNNSEKKTLGDFIFSYMLDPTEEKISKLQKLSKESKIPVIYITDRQFDKDAKEKLLRNERLIEDASIEDLIYHMMNAKYIITDSYHGFCFSLIFRKNFLALVNHNRGSSRFETLGKSMNVETQLVDNLNGVSLKRLEVDYSCLNNLIEREITRSKNWLNNALHSRAKKRYDVLDFIIKRLLTLDRKNS